ncbi:MAG TPA: lysylphosphatidylglycerol synthase transmembrane domain-containing protein [Methylomirabilota bacterium]|nr:lysylphosphatidylglycerol synthase transmembrane domain-containing protein [Methylomirabilota bacterium]
MLRSPASTQGQRRGNPRFVLARTALGLGLIAYLGVSGAIDWSALTGLVKAWRLTAAALLLLFLAVVASSWRLCILLRGQGLYLSLGASLRLSLLGAFFNNFMPGSNGGDLVRIYLAAKPHPGRRTEIGTTLVIDRAIGLLALLLTPLLVAAVGRGAVVRNAALDGLLLFAALTSVALVAGTVMCADPDGVFRRGAMHVFRRFSWSAYAEPILDSVHAHRRNSRVLVCALGISALIQGLVIQAIQLILLANGAPSPSWGSALLTPFGMLANALPLTPGGLGVGEVAFDALFLLVGVTGGAEALLAWRALTTLIDLGGGAVLLAGRTGVSMMGAERSRPLVERGTPADPGAS